MNRLPRYHRGHTRTRRGAHYGVELLFLVDALQVFSVGVVEAHPSHEVVDTRDADNLNAGDSVLAEVEGTKPRRQQIAARRVPSDAEEEIEEWSSNRLETRSSLTMPSCVITVLHAYSK